MAAVALPAHSKSAPIVHQSACQVPRPRSCSPGSCASRVDTRPGARSPAWSASIEATGLRLCGIAEEPPRPAPPGSNTSATSPCISSDTSRPIRAIAPVSSPSSAPRRATRSRLPCQEISGAVSPSRAASASATASPRPPSAARMPLAPPSCSTRTASSAPASPARERTSGDSQQASFQPKGTGVAGCSSVRPVIVVARCASARRASASPARASCACSSAPAAAAASASAVSTTSWLVAPQCTQRAAWASSRPTASVSACTNGIASVPAWRAAAASAPGAKGSAASAGAAVPAGRAPWALPSARASAPAATPPTDAAGPKRAVQTASMRAAAARGTRPASACAAASAASKRAIAASSAASSKWRETGSLAKRPRRASLMSSGPGSAGRPAGRRIIAPARCGAQARAR